VENYKWAEKREKMGTKGRWEKGRIRWKHKERVARGVL